MKILKCSKCGNMAFMLKDSKVPMMCCGEQMKELNPLLKDGAVEKHVPVYKINKNKVDIVVGSVVHPMEEKHYIEWIILETDINTYIKKLNYTDEPKATFILNDEEKVVGVYEHCNLHGFWKAE